MSLHIDYDEYVKADISEKKKLIINNILSSVKSISKRAKLDYKSFENDVKKFCKVEQIILWNFSIVKWVNVYANYNIATTRVVIGYNRVDYSHNKNS